MELLKRIDRYLLQTGTPPTTFGRRVVNDPRLVGDLRNGREPGRRLSARVRRFLEAAGW